MTQTPSSKLTALTGVYKYFVGEQFQGSINQTLNNNGSSRTTKQGVLSGPTVAMSLYSDALASATGTILSSDTRFGTQKLEAGERFEGSIDTTRNSDGSVRITKQGVLSGPTVAAALFADMMVSASGTPTGVAVLSGTWRVGARTFRGMLDVSINGTSVTVRDNRI